MVIKDCYDCAFVSMVLLSCYCPLQEMVNFQSICEKKFIQKVALQRVSRYYLHLNKLFAKLNLHALESIKPSSWPGPSRVQEEQWLSASSLVLRGRWQVPRSVQVYERRLRHQVWRLWRGVGEGLRPHVCWGNSGHGRSCGGHRCAGGHEGLLRQVLSALPVALLRRLGVPARRQVLAGFCDVPI